MPKSLVQLEHADVLEQNQLAEIDRLRQYAEQQLVPRLLNNVNCPCPSMKEQRCLLEAQSRLAELGNIIQRRMKRLQSLEDSERWSATIIELRRLGQKSGASPWPFVEHLPKNLPGTAKGPTKYRSRMKQYLRNYLTDHPNATASEILGHFDEQGIEGPPSWYGCGTRELTVAYRKDQETRNLIDSMVSKVRADMNV